ncbi:hypothetical protein TYRP_001400 [Tyrophagus putrescentiae]|nr:hypothetical protein TYRP_001400 [Tyrophagus putrescentiae]
MKIAKWSTRFLFSLFFCLLGFLASDAKIGIWPIMPYYALALVLLVGAFTVVSGQFVGRGGSYNRGGSYGRGGGGRGIGGGRLGGGYGGGRGGPRLGGGYIGRGGRNYG